MKERCKTIKNAINNAKTALIVSHVDPDGDSIGSMIALGIVLEKLGIEVALYSQDGVPRTYRFLPGIEKVKNKVTQNQHYDLLIAVDSSDIRRLGDKIEPRNIAKLIVNIDHHIDNTKYGDINCVQKSSSTAELVYEIIKFLKIKIDRQVAENLYVALITDTGNYRYENTTAETFIMAQDMLKAGVDTHALTTRIYDNKSVAGIRVQAKALTTLEISPDRKVAWAVVTQKMMESVGAKGEDLIGLVDQIRSVEGIEVAVLFREENGKVKVNLRSKEDISVSEIAKKFGGGGHLKAAGTTIDGDIQKVKHQVISEIIKYIKTHKSS
jgi:phosphoesterase RecJ-like protein